MAWNLQVVHRRHGAVSRVEDDVARGRQYALDFLERCALKQFLRAPEACSGIVRIERRQLWCKLGRETLDRKFSWSPGNHLVTFAQLVEFGKDEPSICFDN